jgi:ribosomal protein S7
VFKKALEKITPQVEVKNRREVVSKIQVQM